MATTAPKHKTTPSTKTTREQRLKSVKKNGNNRSKTQNHPKHKNDKGTEIKERQGE
ncbi:hypothetical protein [Helicobacter pylori]|uniref:hypothetical protein n=1 Tax=Helicobacter pylori TaxID=210 RepID=UPI0013CE277C|nr:hypothetical protein [Helicobacter pylori]